MTVTPRMSRVSDEPGAVPSARYRGVDLDLPPRHNEDVAWEEFAPIAYWEHNYRFLRKDDAAILKQVGLFFAQHFWSAGGPYCRGLDVGSGANLYPALTMLPWCHSITLTDVSPANVAWLRENVTAGAFDRAEPWGWQPFWNELARFVGYRRLDDPAARLAAVQQVRECSVLDLPLGDGRYDVGTMFFVAESITSYETEYEDATMRFLDALLPGAPFAAAFMDSSHGYVVDDRPYPAVHAVNAVRVEQTLIGLGARARVMKIDVPASDPLRDGYDGMIVAVGTTATD
jgi:hypothetical protein